MIVVLYLVAIVAANLSVATFGPSAIYVNAFVLIGLDLSLRDALHERWHRHNLAPKMFALIATGSVLSWAIDRGAGRIAVASAVAFGAAALADTVVFHLARRWPRLVRMNASNSVSAAVDSLLFPTIAFGAFMPLVTLGQYLAKVVGGAVWAWVLIHAYEYRCEWCHRPGWHLWLMIDAETGDRIRLHERCVVSQERAWGFE